MKRHQYNPERFQRQILLPEVGVEGQKTIQRAKILLIGAGGLGSSAAFYLTAAGVGTLGIVDEDRVEMTNLNRQILHTPDRIGQLKVSSARQTLTSFCDSINIVIHPVRIQELDQLTQIISEYDFVVDCTDNFATRFLINEACLRAGIPWVYGAVSGFEGQAMTIIPGQGPCYRCLYAGAPPASEPLTPVIGIASGIIGIIQAAEALKYILGRGNLLTGRLLYVDLLEMALSEFRVKRDSNCQSCGQAK
jgi:molybdopterin/thiamine biosynthesis adenylyltransferase